ncbi:MAG TPA: PRC-barrel domain-containing protein [Candidatus Saccharimonadales bacterium]|nr:PRC-barrel domain-containing protein [Candidatus Saccharimonadales bacterium]
MSVLLRATDLEGRPVVTLGGERVAEVKDVVFDSARGKLIGFSLRGVGLLSRSREDALPWNMVSALGRDAVMILDEGAFQVKSSLAAEGIPDDRNVLGNLVLTDTGTHLGTVVDVIIEVGPTADIVGYEVAAAEALASRGERVLIPLPDTIAISGEHLIVPAAATDFVANDLTGFGAAVDAFRTKLHQGG